MKRGLVMEGGALKGIFTAGVMDVFLENEITFDGAVGVSAGAVFGCNYKSKQIGRAVRYNKKYAKDPRYAGIGNLLREGNLYGVEFCYHEIPWKLDLWDMDTYLANPMEFVAVATNLETGLAEYHACEKGDEEDVEWLRASASVPIASKIVEIGDYKLLDGGVADPLPLKFFQERGYTHNVVITTKPVDYIRPKKKSAIAAEKFWYRKYPKFAEALGTYPDRYNMQMKYLAEQEASGNAIIIRPIERLHTKPMNNDPEYLEYIYQMGRTEGLKNLEKVRAYLGE